MSDSNSQLLATVEKAPATVKGATANTSVGNLAEYVQQLAERDPAPGSVFLAESYIAELRNADKQQSRWRRFYYEWRGFVIVASAMITVLTALNLHGGAAFALRLTTLILSGLVTITTGLLELLQVNNRWRVYRQLRTTLEEVGWQTAQGTATPAVALAKLGNGLMGAMRTFEAHYISQVASATDLGGEEPKEESDEEPKASGRPKPDAT